MIPWNSVSECENRDITTTIQARGSTVMHICNPSNSGGWGREWQLWGQLRLLSETLSSLSLSQNVYIQRREGRDRRGQTASYCSAELHLQDKKSSSHKLSYAAVLTLTKETTLTFLPSWKTMDAHLSWVYTGGRLLHRLTFAHVWWGPLLPSSQWNGGRETHLFPQQADNVTFIQKCLNMVQAIASLPGYFMHKAI